jgi:hypothetical protein
MTLSRSKTGAIVLKSKFDTAKEQVFLFALGKLFIPSTQETKNVYRYKKFSG